MADRQVRISIKIDGVDQEIRSIDELQRTMQKLETSINDVNEAGEDFDVKGADDAIKKISKLDTEVQNLNETLGETANVSSNLDIPSSEQLTQNIRNTKTVVQDLNTEISTNSRNASEILKNLFETLGFQIPPVVGQLQGFSDLWPKITKGITLSAGALRVLKIALAATGIGALVVVLGSLIASFADANDEVDTFNSTLNDTDQSTQNAGNAFTRLIDRLRGVRTAANEAKNAAQNVGSGIDVTQYKELNDTQVTLTKNIQGINQAIDDFLLGLVGVQTQNRKLQQDLAKATGNLENLQKNSAKNTAEANEKLAEQNRIIQDINSTTAERIAAAQKAKDIEDGILKQQQQIVAATKTVSDLRLKELEEGLSRQGRALKGSTEELALKEAVQKVEVELIDLRTKAADSEFSRQQQILQFQKEQTQAVEDSVQQQIDAQNELRAANEKAQAERDAQTAREIQRRDAIVNTLETLKVKSIEITRERSLAELQIEERKLIESLKFTQQEEEEKQKIRDFYQVQREKIVKESEEKIQEILIGIRQDTLKTELDLQLEELEGQRRIDEQRLIQEAATQEQLLQLYQLYDDKRQLLLQDNQKKINEVITGLILETAENAGAAAQLKLQLELEAELESLSQLNASEEEKQKVRELYGKKQTKLLEDLAKAEKAINQQKLEAGLLLASQVFRGITALVGEESKFGKATAIASATIDTYAAANKALATFPPPASYIAAGVAIAAGIANVLKIAKTQLPGAPGGGGVGGISPSVPTPSDVDPTQTLRNIQGLDPTDPNFALQQTGSRAQVLRAYVVSEDVTRTQEIDRKIKNLARL